MKTECDPKIHALLVGVLEDHKKLQEISQRLFDEDDPLSEEIDAASNTLDLVADYLGVPKDNTVETGACDAANATGEWPEWGYCRDWLLNWEGTSSELVCEMKRHAKLYGNSSTKPS